LVSTKLDTFCYLTVQTACTVLRAVVLTQCRRVTDGQTDKQTDGIAIASTALAMRALWRAVTTSGLVGFFKMSVACVLDFWRKSQCMIVQNVVAIGQTVAKIWRFFIFPSWRTSAILDL